HPPLAEGPGVALADARADAARAPGRAARDCRGRGLPRLRRGLVHDRHHRVRRRRAARPERPDAGPDGALTPASGCGASAPDGTVAGTEEAPMPMVLASRRYPADDLLQAMELCFEKGWTDGLPVIPPTEPRVRALLDL